jgi:hypothetical protein
MNFTALFLALVVFVTPIASAQRRVRSSLTSPAAVSSQTTQTSASTLPIRRVILYSNGVAYFERRGTVNGHAEVALQFKQSQVDDVLKSMVVLDLGNGRIGAVSYNSSAPPSARLNDIPFSIASGTQATATGGLAGVLKQLQGAKVAVTTGVRTALGSVLTVEERKSQIDANKPPLTTFTLVIASDAGELTSFDLAEVRSVKLVDEGSKRDISQFADATASARRRDAKTIVVTSDGQGPREMVVSYTVAAPIWKTSYRVVLDYSGQPFFQGWAIVDNVTEEDWHNVSLSLVSGTPVSFIQPIQQPLYRYRPVVPIPSDLKLDPQTYEPEQGAVGGSTTFGGFAGGQVSTVNGFYSPNIQQRQTQDLPLNGRNTQNMMSMTPGTVAAPPPTPSLSDTITSSSSVETAASGEEVGDLFEYKIDQPVTVLHDKSALIPILQTRMDGERVSIYNPAVRRDRPVGGLRLTNTSKLTLEDGALTVIDGDAYAGEALLARFKPGEKRLISFALDLGTLVTARTDANREPVLVAKAVNGVLQISYYQVDKRTYKITNQTDKARIVYLEHPRRLDWKLVDQNQKPVDETQNFYRFRVELAPRAIVELPVKERHQITDNYSISTLARSDVDAFIARGAIDSSVRTILEKIIDVKNRMAIQDQRIASLQAERQQIDQDQARLRDNIKALKDTSEARELIARYVAKANQQETRIEQLATDEKAVQTEKDRLQTELAAVLVSFDPGQKGDR